MSFGEKFSSSSAAARRKAGRVLAFIILFFGLRPAMAAEPSGAVPDTGTQLRVAAAYGVDGLVLWLSADSGVKMDAKDKVFSLTDETGNFTLTSTGAERLPTLVPRGLNGRPVLRFNGNQALYSGDNFGPALDRDMTIIIVAAATSADLDREQYPLYLGDNTTVHVNRALAFYQRKEIFDGQFVLCWGPSAAINKFVVMGASINPSLTLATFYRNGEATLSAGLAPENGNAKFENLSEGVTLGAATDPVCGWQGDIAEELVFDRQLTPAEMQKISLGIAAKYGLTL